MIAKFVKDYFTFSKKERVAVIILVFLIFIMVALPYLLPTKEESFNKAGFAKFRQEASRLRVDKDVSVNEKPGNARASPANLGVRRGYAESKEVEDGRKPAMFYFDPNTLDYDGWKKMGIPEKNIQTIQNYVSKGGKFRNAEDIGKIYGLRQADLTRLKPFVRIRSVGPAYPPKKPERQGQYEHGGSLPLEKSPLPLIDLNLSDTNALISLPGIGSKLATRIIRFREKLGGFYSTHQLAEVYGLPDSTFQRLQQRITVSGSRLKKINVNTATLQDLQDHPYLRGTTARLVLEYRNQHGSFNTIEELLQVETITPELFKRLSHYLTVTAKP